MNITTTVQRTSRVLPSTPRTPAATTTFSWGALLALLGEWRLRSHTRAQTHGLDDRMLRDIGLTRAEVLAEYDKPFWLA